MQTNVAESVATMPKFNPVITEDDLTITPAARTKMTELFDDVDDEVSAIRVFVSGGGCGGMSYGMTFTDQQYETDYVLESDGFAIYVDAVAMSFLRGVEIDFKDRGPAGASFVFNNAFAITGGGTCSACGAAGGGCA